jgi:hypothetical protein
VISVKLYRKWMKESLRIFKTWNKSSLLPLINQLQMLKREICVRNLTKTWTSFFTIFRWCCNVSFYMNENFTLSWAWEYLWFTNSQEIFTINFQTFYIIDKKFSVSKDLLLFFLNPQQNSITSNVIEVISFLR